MYNEGVKFDGGKPAMELLPPDVIVSLAKVFGYGAMKYQPRNWEKGMAWGRLYAACLRHTLAWWGGEDNDPESGHPHLVHALACLTMLIEYQDKEIGSDDRPNSAGDASSLGDQQDQRRSAEVPEQQAQLSWEDVRRYPNPEGDLRRMCAEVKRFC